MKKLISMMLALVMVLSLIPTALAADTSPVEKFVDVPANAPYYEALEYAVHNGYISGTSATTFSPDLCLTRGQFVTILGRMMGVSGVSGVTKFVDVKSNAWYAPYVAWAANLGVVSGTSATTFAPDSVLTVEQLGTMLARYLTLTGAKATVQKENVQYADKAKIASWAASSMETMRQYGIILPDVRGNVNPQSQVKRCDGVVALVAFAKALGMGEDFRKEEPPKEEEPPVIKEPPVDPVEPPVKPITGDFKKLAGTGVTYKDLIPSDWYKVTGFIWPHDPQDIKAAVDNVIWMAISGEKMSFELSDESLIRDYNYIYELAIGNSVEALGNSGSIRVNKITEQTAGRWVRGEYIPGEFVTHVVLSGQLKFETSRQYTEAFEKACEIHDELWSSGKITSSMTEREKAWEYCCWLEENVEYSSGADPYTALVLGRAQCAGYAEAIQVLLMTEDINCFTLVMRLANHDNNVVCLDGEWVGVDPTWFISDAWWDYDIDHHSWFGYSWSELAGVHPLEDCYKIAFGLK